MLMSLLLALAGCLLTGFQAALILYRGNGICFNEGCAIVDSLTLVSPLYFNLAGFLFFLLVAASIHQARKDSPIWQRFVSVLLISGFAAEAVLFSFQLFVTKVFCSYCLIIFGLVVFANIFIGLKQIFRGCCIFTAIVMAFASLDFGVDAGPTEKSLEYGSIARITISDSTHELYFFFSPTCPHCEAVIEKLKNGVACTVNFNPIAVLDTFSFPGADRASEYTPQINIDFLQSLGISNIPTLVDKYEGGITIWTGSDLIETFLELNCQVERPESLSEITENRGRIGQSEGRPLLLDGPEKNCSVLEDCEKGPGSMEESFNQQSVVQ